MVENGKDVKDLWTHLDRAICALVVINSPFVAVGYVSVTSVPRSGLSPEWLLTALITVAGLLSGTVSIVAYLAQKRPKPPWHALVTLFLALLQIALFLDIARGPAV